jgi:methyl-accepting chemotaxis protein
MHTNEYTPRQILEIKGSFTYFILVLFTTILASSFQAIAKVSLAGMLPPLIINMTAVTGAFFIYRAKKNKKEPVILPWIVAFITVSAPILAKYNYAKIDWTFAVESYNSSIVLVFFIIVLQLQYRKKLFIVMSAWGLSNWILFYYLAYLNGAEMHLDAMVDGKPIHGFIILREIFFMIMTFVLCYVGYNNIPIIDEYDKRANKQKDTILKQAEQQKEINREITEKMDIFFKEIDEQNSLITIFNEKMQSQAATYEQVSATLEELLGSAELIHESSVDQVDGNVKMETIVNEFKNIKHETKGSLDTAYNGMADVVSKTSSSNDKLAEVEKTINTIQDQSSRISNTVSIIVDIADRINLLSLNAAIEAARAGEFGRGFAVVADEIGKLAVQTSDSIKEIENVLSLNVKITNDGVEVIRSTAAMIKDMLSNIDTSSNNIKILQESILIEEKYINIIIEQMFKNIELARDIGSGTDEQKNAIRSTNDAIEHVNSIVGEMVKEINRLAQTSQKILENAVDLLNSSKEAVIS